MKSRGAVSRLAIMLLLSATILGCSKKEDPPTEETKETRDSHLFTVTEKGDCP